MGKRGPKPIPIEKLKDSSVRSRIHQWLIINYKNPLKCEFYGKIGHKVKSLRCVYWNIQWALIKDKQYSMNRDNFLGLCCKCYRNYDEWLHPKKYLHK